MVAGRMWNWMSGPARVGTRLAEGGDMGGRQGQQALALEQVFQRLARQAAALALLVDRHDAGLQPIAHAGDIVVLQVLADAGQVWTTAIPCSAQQLARTDAGQLQQLRRVDRPAGQDHLGPRLGGAA
jgi:hypothetical protein